MAKKLSYDELEKRVKELEKEVLARNSTGETFEESGVQLRNVLETLEMIAISLDTQGKITFTNDFLLHLTDWKRGEILGKDWFENFLPPDMRDQIKKSVFLKTLQTGEFPAHYQNEIMTKKGERRLINWTNTVFRNSNGKVISVTSIGEDITDRKRAEEELRESEARYRALFHYIPNGVAVYKTENDGEDFIFVDFNEASEKIESIKKENLIGKSVLEIFPGVRDFGLFDVFQRVWKTGKPEEHPITLYKDDRIAGWRDNFVYKLPSGEIVAVYSDETEHQQAYEKLRVSEERYRTLVNTAPYGIQLTDLEGKILFSNPAHHKIQGYADGELIGKYVWDLVADDKHKSQTKEYYHYLVKEQPPPEIYFTKDKTNDSRLIDTQINWDYIRNSKSELEGIISIISDITKRKRAEEELRKREERYGLLFNSGNDAVFVNRVEKGGPGKFTEVNDLACKRLGYSRDELLKMSPVDIDAEGMNEARHQALEELEKAGQCVFEMIHTGKSGDKIPVEISSRVFESEGKPYVLSIARDITERKELEAQLRQAQKMESIGTLAGGIAHDFNNILSPIMIYAEMAMLELPPDSPTYENIRHIHKAGERARDLVKQILTFARRKEEDRIFLRTSLIVKEAVKFLRSTIPTTIELHYDLKAEQDTVLADPTQMNEIVMNLCTNAAHAMREKGGLLKVSLINEYIDPDRMNRFDSIISGQYLRMSISDSGSGIPDNIIDKIFEPYFTTKGLGEGTGMGLALVHGIVKSYSGDITVESEIGQGTTFHVLLPIAELEISLKKEPEIEIPRGRERILFIDDEKAAVDAMRAMLERLGYKVAGRTSSIEALKVFRHKPDAFDLVITDMTMPNMTGKELARELMFIRPDIPVIICTGFSENIDEKGAREMGVRAFVMKPIVMSEMANTIRKVLE